MKLYLTKEEIEELEDTGEYWDDLIHLLDDIFDWRIKKQIYTANSLGFPFSISLKKLYVVESMYNGGVLIRPYDKSVDYAIQNID